MNELIADFLINTYGAFLRLSLLLMIAVSLANAKDAGRFFRGIRASTWWWLAAVCVSAVALRLWAIPHMHHVYSDEYAHLNIAENFLYSGRFCVTVKGSYNSCEIPSIGYWPPAYHYLLSLALAVFGDSEAVAFNFSAIAGALSVAAVFFMVFLLSGNEHVALLSAFFLNLVPVHLKYSASAGTTITSILFIILAFLAALVYARRCDLKSLLLSVFISVWAVYVRPENGILLFLIPLLIVLFLDPQKAAQRKKYEHLAVWCGLALVFCIPYFLHMYLCTFVWPNIGWNQGMAARVHNLGNNFSGNLSFWVSRFHPWSFTFAACYGAMVALKKMRKQSLFFLLWAAAFLFFFTQQYAGNFLAGADSDRYTLNIYLSMAIFAAAGVNEFVHLFKYKAAFAAILLTYVVTEIPAPVRIGLERTYNRDVYQEYKFILAHRHMIPDHLYVITYMPAAVISTIHKAAMVPEAMATLSSAPTQTVLFKDSWWYLYRQHSDSVEKYLLQHYDFKTLGTLKLAGPAPYSFVMLTRKETAASRIAGGDY